MKARVFFSNHDGDCRLELTHRDGHIQHVLFENTSSLVNYCNENGIEVPLSECRVEY